MKVKFIEIDEHMKIIDGLSKLVIFKNYDPQTHPEGKWVPCSFREFSTKKGREAIEVDFSKSGHLCKYYLGGGDRSWGDWDLRRAANATFADAASTSNGGGCWWEIQIIKEGVEPISTEKSSYLDEIS